DIPQVPFYPGKGGGRRTSCEGICREKDRRSRKGPAPGLPFKREPRIPVPGGGSDERQIRQCRPALPAGAGVRAVRPAYLQAEHGELDDPVRGEVSCSPL